MAKEECLYFLNGKIPYEEYLLLEYWLSDRERNILGMKRKTFEIKSVNIHTQFSKGMKVQMFSYAIKFKSQEYSWDFLFALFFFPVGYL